MAINTITGSAGNDTLSGTGDADIFRLKQGGDDTASGLAGDDAFYLGASFTALDAIDGGDDLDKVWLSGDYSAGVTFGAATMTNVEILRLGGTFDQNFTTHDATVAAGARLAVNASPLAAGHKLTFDGSAETNGRFNIIASAGDDVLTGGARGDVFRLTNGGVDSAYGGAGNDKFFMGNTFTANDTIDGGLGTDTVNFIGFGGDDDLVFTATTMIGVETLMLAAGIVPTLVTHDATVAAGATLTVDGSAAGGYQFDGSAETDGAFILVGSASGNVLKGGAGVDTFDLTLGGDDTAHGSDGNDIFDFGAQFTAGDTVDGGAGNDTIALNGDYGSAGPVLFTFGASQLISVETLTLGAGHAYALGTSDGNVASGATLTIDASALAGPNDFFFYGVAETDGSFNITGGAGYDSITSGSQADTIDGGAGGDPITGGGGADTLTGGAGGDTFIYNDASESNSAAYDTITDLNGGPGLDLVYWAGGLVSYYSGPSVSHYWGSLDDDLSHGCSGMGEYHYTVVYLADISDPLFGRSFLVIDANATFGYTAGADIVIDITGYTGAPSTLAL